MIKTKITVETKKSVIDHDGVERNELSFDGYRELPSTKIFYRIEKTQEGEYFYNEVMEIHNDNIWGLENRNHVGL